MQNPWEDIEEDKEVRTNADGRKEFVAQVDQEVIDEYRKKITDPKRQLRLDVLPEPVIGDPTTAALVALQLNPGASPKDRPDKKRSSDYRAFEPMHERILGNLHGHNREMYWAEPTPNFGDDGEELYSSPHTWYFGAEDSEGKLECIGENRAKYKLLHLVLSSRKAREEVRELKDFGLRKVKKIVEHYDDYSSERAYSLLRKKFAVIEYFPYHSESRPNGLVSAANRLPSTAYSRELLDSALHNGAFIFLTRSVKDWDLRLDRPEFKKDRIIVSSSAQSAKFSPGNLRRFDGSKAGYKGIKDPELFWKAVDRIDPIG